MESDRDLLSLYAKEGRQAAFAEVVRRHTDFVYSTALRLVAGDTHLAQDVSQTVFTALANKAASLAHHDSLLGWLHTATRYAASDAVRRERRRRTREQESSTMNDNLSASEPNWAQLQPLLDEAVGRLRVQDREAVLLRFFHSQTHREVGATLGLDETLVRKRVDRALEKMRVFLSRRGVTTTSALLATAITTHSVHAAPAGLAATLGNTSLAHAAITGGFWHSVLYPKIKSSALAATILIFGAIPITVASMQLGSLDEQNVVLAKKNAEMETSLAQLQADLHEASHGDTLINAVAKTPLGAGYIPVNLEAIKKLAFSIVNSNFKLTEDATGLLGLTPLEASQAQGVFDELQKRVFTYKRSRLRSVEPDSLNSDDILRFIKEHPGKLSAFVVPAMSEEENAALQKWFADGMTTAIGRERTQIVLEKTVGKWTEYSGQKPGYHTDATNLWLMPGIQLVMVFSDRLESDGAPLTSSWISEYTGLNGGSVGSYFNAPYPPFLGSLLKDVRPRQPVPVLNLIMGNLRTIAEFAIGHLEFNHTDTVSYAQLISGAQYIRGEQGPVFDSENEPIPVKPVAGESYDGIVYHKGDKTLTVNVPKLGAVTYVISQDLLDAPNPW